MAPYIRGYYSPSASELNVFEIETEEKKKKKGITPNDDDNNDEETPNCNDVEYGTRCDGTEDEDSWTDEEENN